MERANTRDVLVCAQDNYGSPGARLSVIKDMIIRVALENSQRGSQDAKCSKFDDRLQ